MNFDGDHLRKLRDEDARQFAELATDVGELSAAFVEVAGSLRKMAVQLDVQADGLRKVDGGLLWARSTEDLAKSHRQSAASMDRAGEIVGLIVASLERLSGVAA